jgi:hypothetical protein
MLVVGAKYAEGHDCHQLQGADVRRKMLGIKGLVRSCEVTGTRNYEGPGGPVDPCRGGGVHPIRMVAKGDYKTVQKSAQNLGPDSWLTNHCLFL